MKFKYVDKEKIDTWIYDRYKIIRWNYLKVGNVFKYDPHYKSYYDGYSISSNNYKELEQAINACKTHYETEVIYDEN